MEANIFNGIRIVEFSWVVTGPSTTRLFAMHGATVIKVESSTRPEISRMTRPYKEGMSLNRSGFFARHNNDKLSVSLNLNHPKGLEIVKRLIASVDIVVEAFTPGQMVAAYTKAPMEVGRGCTSVLDWHQRPRFTASPSIPPTGR